MATAPSPALARPPSTAAWPRRLAVFLTKYLAPLPPPPKFIYRGRFAAYLGLLGISAVAIAAYALFSGRPVTSNYDVGLLALLLICMCALSCFYIVEVVPGGTLWTPADFLTFSAIFILGPIGVVSAALGQGLGYALRRHPNRYMVGYTITTDMVNGMVGWLVFTAYQHYHLGGGTFAAALVTGAVYDLVNLLLLMMGVSLGKHAFVGWGWLSEMKFTLPFTVGYAWAALGAAKLDAGIGPVAISMVAIPVVLFQGFLVYLSHEVHLHGLETEAAHAERVNLLQELVVKQRGFVADAAHELRTPLTTMAGGLEIMSEFPDMDEAQRRQLVADALGESRRMQNLVDSLLELAQLDTGEETKRRSFNWTNLMHSAAQEMETIFAPRKFTTEFGTDLGDGYGDEPRLRRLMVILANNVAAHTPEDAIAKLTVNRREDGIINIALEDDGPGIPSVMIDRTFERFVQIDPSRHDQAPGLGLSIARSIATIHDGSIGAQEVLPHGLRVVVRIPPGKPPEPDPGQLQEQ